MYDNDTHTHTHTHTHTYTHTHTHQENNRLIQWIESTKKNQNLRKSASALAQVSSISRTLYTGLFTGLARFS